MKPLLTVDAVHDAADRVVDRVGPDHIDENGGRYTDPASGDLCCAVAYILDDLGVPRDTIESLDTGALTGGVASIGLAINLGLLPFTVEPDAKEYLRIVQSCQDTGHTWADAVDRAAAELRVGEEA